VCVSVCEWMCVGGCDESNKRTGNQLYTAWIRPRSQTCPCKPDWSRQNIRLTQSTHNFTVTRYWCINMRYKALFYSQNNWQTFMLCMFYICCQRNTMTQSEAFSPKFHSLYWEQHQWRVTTDVLETAEPPFLFFCDSSNIYATN